MSRGRAPDIRRKAFAAVTSMRGRRIWSENVVCLRRA
jgi:hypothetical protein